MRRIAVTLSCTAWLATARVSRADDASFGASARVERPMAALQREDPTAAGTTIDTREREAAHESMSDVLLEVPGARPYRTGGLGTFTTAALRGADAEHTAVLFGEIPLSSADAAAFDLSILPLSLTERVVVYRGGAPLWLGQGAIGGVIQLVPQREHAQEGRATASAGSFGTYGLSTETAVAPNDPRAPRLHTSAGVLGSSGDFPIAFDNKTAFDRSDDYTLRRPNADFAQGHALLQLQQALGPGGLELLLLGFDRSGGEPGAPADPVLHARRQQLRGMAALAYTVERGQALRVQALAAVSGTRARFADRLGEVGTSNGSTSSDDSVRVFGRLAATAALTEFMSATLLATATHDAYDPSDALARVAMPSSERNGVVAAGELDLHARALGRRFTLRPSLRVEHSAVALHSERFGAAVLTEHHDTLPTYRAGAGVELLPGLSLSGSFASGARLPSLLELFGDGGLLLGNTALRPERSRSVDIGLVDVTCIGDFAGSFEARLFDLAIDDEVLFVRNSFSQLLPLNLEHSHVRGLEAGARVQLAHYAFLNGAATLLDTEGKPGKRLPNRPRATLFVQPGVSSPGFGPFASARAFVELNYISSSYDDPDNQTAPKPGELFVDVGATLIVSHPRLALRATVTDLFDRRGQDLRHFPLPGRTVMFSLTYDEGRSL